MFQADNIEDCVRSVVKAIEKLDQENKRLHEEKTNLLDIEAKLQAKASEELAVRKQENDELRVEVENLKKRCEELTQYINRQATENGCLSGQAAEID